MATEPAPPAGNVWRFDVVAGLTAAAVVIPKAMAYAAVAGLPVAVGLYTAFIPMIVYAVLGTSRVLSVSSTTTLAILAGTELAIVVPDGDPAKLITATATLAALVGAILVLARVARLGFVADFRFQRDQVGHEVGRPVGDLLDAGALRAFHQHLDGAVRQFQHLQDIGHAADFVNVRWRRLILGGRLLGRQHDALALLHGGFQRLDGFWSANKQRDYHVREDYNIPQRQQRQLSLLS
jgi:hypothetical protein